MNLKARVNGSTSNDDPLKRLRDEVAEVDAADSRVPATGADRFMRYVEGPLGVVLALAVGAQTYNATCSAVGCANAGFGLPILFVAAMAGLLAIGLYRKQVQDWRFRWELRLALNGFALLLIAVMLVLPQLRSAQKLAAGKAVATAERQQAEAASQQTGAARQKAEEVWRAGMLVRGDHGPPGEVPPLLRVETADAVATVTNIAKKPLTVALARVRQDAAPPGVWRACAMHTAGNQGSGMRYYRYSLAPGERTTFVSLESCGDAFKDALIEYRIGQYPEEPAWWSDSALAAPDRREDAGGK